MPQVTLLGLPEDLANQLTRVLLAESHKVNRKLFAQDLQHGPNPNAVFISGDNPGFRSLISVLREDRPDLPVIVVTRLPETGRWLDALDAGATDYCGAPFERVQLRWILGPLLC